VIPSNLTIREAGQRLRDGSLTSAALTESMLERAEKLNPVLGAFTTFTRERALERAEKADAELAQGTDLGPLHGIPLVIKDIIDMEGAPTSANSEIHDRDPKWAVRTDAVVVSRLRRAGSVFLGKATTSEFAIGLPDAEKRFLVPHNPWDITRSAAGSSSGTGVSVSAGLALGGLGTDTGGSVRGPSCVSGISGLKVTYGRVPKSGIVPLAHSLDSVGPMARSAYDCALLLEVMAGHDDSDPTSAKEPVERYTDALTGDLNGLRIGVPEPYFLDNDQLDPEVRDGVLAAVDRLVGIGAVASRFELQDADLAKEANQLIMVSEAFAYHRSNFQQYWTDYGRGSRGAIGRAMFFSADDYAQANRFRRHFARTVAAAFQKFDVLIVPTMIKPAEVLAEMSTSKRLGQASYMGQWNLTGLPAMSIPSGFHSTGLPLAVQIVGRPFAEATILRVADALQRQTDWHLAAPPVEALVA
jgi:aspartyl-tRNA(Asn)/glutamyl-tRNA(Gln) amidotransferase subunit A